MKSQLSKQVVDGPFDADLFVVGGGRVACALPGSLPVIMRSSLLPRVSVRRHLRNPRLRSEKASGLRASYRHEFEDAAGFGWTIPSATFGCSALIANKDREIARLEGIYTSNVEKSGSRIVKTRAVFEDAHTLRLGTGETVRARCVLIATGGAPNHGATIPGIEHVISSNEVFHLPKFKSVS